ncbi:unnamed protein product [Urochloa decumbens]|uniref:Uncharacterized protein n=1 Tax=Urochloa decumbens TaxID=240449 RepID=A0ABC9B9A1_9POAL
MGDEYKKIKGLRKKETFLQRELRDMDALLEKMDSADELDPQAKNWRKDIIEMSYNIEDCIDDSMQCIGQANNKTGILREAFKYVRSFKNLHHPANQFEEIKAQVMEASERRKRYFIIVDDLWDIRAWYTIQCAFPENNHYSRVMITTRNEDLARLCCGNHRCIHNMKPLSEPDSRILFFDRIFGSENACPYELRKASCEILKKCGGLPLAIITMASMLACQQTRSEGQWEYIQNSLATNCAINSNYEDMMNILDLSYKNLPRHLKACFLYLGSYPEDHEINRDELVRRWVAEGFVSSSTGEDVWDVAECYFNELVNRSMIQPVAKNYAWYITAGIQSCRVHDMLLELIARRCKEDNFLSLVNFFRKRNFIPVSARVLHSTNSYYSLCLRHLK